jgi:hypothetical protein
MASQLYPKGKKRILDGDIDLLVDDIRCVLIDTTDETYNAADEYLSHIAAGGIVATYPSAFTGKTTIDGVFDANDLTFTSNVSGDTVEAIVIYKWTGASATSPLIGWFDISTYTPIGTGVSVKWNASGIFAI